MIGPYSPASAGMRRRGTRARRMWLTVAGAGTVLVAVVVLSSSSPGSSALAAEPARQPQPRAADVSGAHARSPAQRREPGAEVSARKPGDDDAGLDLERLFESEEARARRAAVLAIPPPRAARSDEQVTGIAEIERLFVRYRKAVAQTERALDLRLVLRAVEGRKQLQASYEEKIARHRTRARELRSQAMRKYEQFLAQRPEDPHWTPEIMFRLAELNFAAERDAFEAREEAWQSLLAEREADGSLETEEMPPSPVPEHEGSLALFTKVVEKFPAYAHSDAALYMRGYLMYQSEDFDGSRASFSHLVCTNRFALDTSLYEGWRDGAYRDCQALRPGSEFRAEAWMRLGEAHYDDDELSAALAAFENAAQDHTASVYSAALLRIGLTHYLRRDFAAAAARLDQFVRYVDGQRLQAGASANSKTDESRLIALEYIAKAYAEEDWDLDGEEDEAWGVTRLDRDYARRNDEPHVADIYVALGELLAERTEFESAIALWNMALERWPTAARAPRTQAMVYEAYLLLHEPELALQARDALATNYLRSSAWFRANADDADAIALALQHSEKALVGTAEDHHVRAQTLRAAGDPEASREYAIAATAYEAFLDRFPHSPNAYEYEFRLADSFYYSGRLLDAARVYAAVRDSNQDHVRQTEAAEGVVLSLEGYVAREVEAGRLRLPELPKAGSGLPMNPIAVPALMSHLQLAYDEFAELEPDAPSLPAMRIGAAEISQRFRHFEDSIERYSEIVQDHCGSNAAIRAGYGLIAAHVIGGDLAGARKWTEKLAELGCGEGDEAEKFSGELQTIENAVRFREAEQLFAGGEFEAAADRYTALVDEAPRDPQADRALNNAAAAYERIGRFSSATAAYQRICKSYPDSEFADDALLRTGFNHARFFQFERALQAYRILAESETYADSQHRQIALLNAATLLDSLQRYERSAALFNRYAEQSSDPAEQAKIRFRAANVVAKLDSPRKTIAAFSRFLNDFADAADQDENILEAWVRVGRAYVELGQKKRAKQAFERCVAEFSRRGAAPASPAADHAAQAQFELAEFRLGRLERIKLVGRGKKLQQAGEQLMARFQDATRDYGLVFPYRRVEWVLAAIYRQGFLWESLANSYRDAPVPKGLRADSEAYYAYLDIIDAKVVRPAEAKAVELYRDALRYGSDYKVRNEWTKRASERLNVYVPDEFPLLREPALLFRLEQ